MTGNPSPYVSIVIPTRNGMPLVEDCLKAVLDQETPWPFEVILIDSESSDGTWELATSLPIISKRISVRDFNHGATRNFAASFACGEFLVFLVQDAVPADNHWLVNLVAATLRDGVAGSYSLQLPWSDDPPLVRLQVEGVMPRAARSVDQRLEPGVSWAMLAPRARFELAAFHNNSSCIRRSVWDRFPFNSLPYGEDLDWGARVVAAGYTVVFETSSRVFHSHNRPAWYEFKRAYADHELVVRLFRHHVYPSLIGVVPLWLKMSLASIRAILQQSDPLAVRIRSAVRTPLVLAARIGGAALGSRISGLDRTASRTPFVVWLDNALRRGV